MPEDPLSRLFARIELAGLYRCEWCLPSRDETPIWLAREPKQPFRDAWSELRFYY